MTRGRIGVTPTPGYDVYFHRWELPTGTRAKGTSLSAHVPQAPVEAACCEQALQAERQSPAGAEPDEPCSSRPGPIPAGPAASGGDAMSLWWTVLSLLAILVLTAGTALFVAAEFSLTALERSTVDANARTGDRRDRFVQRAHRTLSFQLSGAQLGISITTLATGYLAEPVVARFLRPGLDRRRLARRASPVRVALAGALLIATSLSMVFGELVPKNLAALAAGAHRPGHRRTAADVLQDLHPGDQRDQRHRQLDPAPAGHRTRRGAALGAHPRRNWCRWCARRRAAVRWTRSPPRWWTGRCSSASAPPRS